MIIFYRLTIFLALACCCSCERLSDVQSRELAGGYRLKRVRGSNDFALIIPHDTGGLIIEEIGWRNPLIIARGSGSQYWELIDTARAEHRRVSDDSVRSDPNYRSIPVIAADKAWSELSPRARIW